MESIFGNVTTEALFMQYCKYSKPTQHPHSNSLASTHNTEFLQGQTPLTFSYMSHLVISFNVSCKYVSEAPQN